MAKPGIKCATGFEPGQCGVAWRGAKLSKIVFCPLHAAAPDMFEFIKDLADQDCWEDPGEYPKGDEFGKAPCLSCRARTIISKAKEVLEK